MIIKLVGDVKANLICETLYRRNQKTPNQQLLKKIKYI